MLGKRDANAVSTTKFYYKICETFRPLLKYHPRIPENNLPSLFTDFVVVSFADEEELINDVARFLCKSQHAREGTIPECLIEVKGLRT